MLLPSQSFQAQSLVWPCPLVRNNFHWLWVLAPASHSGFSTFDLLIKSHVLSPVGFAAGQVAHAEICECRALQGPVIHPREPVIWV